MCGEIPAGHTGYTQCIRLTEASARVALNQQLKNVTEIRLDEYAIRNPNGGAIAPDLWRIEFVGNLQPHINTNAAGRGYPILVDNTVQTHVIYDRPRLMYSPTAVNTLSSIQLRIADETGALVTFDAMTIFITVVCIDEHWDPAVVMAQSFLAPVNNMQNDALVPAQVGPALHANLQALRNAN